MTTVFSGPKMFWMFRETKGREKCQGGEVNKRLKVKSNFHVDQMLKVEYVEYVHRLNIVETVEVKQFPLGWVT